jgi:hypothetical protein
MPTRRKPASPEYPLMADHRHLSSKIERPHPLPMRRSRLCAEGERFGPVIEELRGPCPSAVNQTFT